MELLATIEEAWGWAGLKPVQVVGDNEFGNFILKDDAGRYWRLCPEDLSCEVLADDRAELDRLVADEAFLQDWRMAELVAEARQRFGPLRPGQKYCLKIPGVLGGAYGGDNLAVISTAELVRASGRIAQQIDGLPDGAQVSVRITE